MRSKLTDVILKNGAERAGHAAVIYKNQATTYAALSKRIGLYAEWMKQAGIVEAARVVLIEPDPVSHIAKLLALWSLGCVVVPVDFQITGEELQRAIAAGQCHWLLSAPREKALLPDARCAGPVQSGELCAYRLEAYPIPGETPMSSDAAIMFYTSGTTGKPKCVLFGHDAMYNNVASLSGAIALGSEDVLFTPLSITLPGVLATVVLPALCAGATMILSSTLLPGGIARQITQYRPTVFFAVPYIYTLLVESSAAGNECWRSVRLCLTSSAYLEKAVFDAFLKAARQPLHSIYCSSEAGAITYNHADDADSLRGCVGSPLHGVEIRIEKDTALHGDAGIGEVLVRGGNISMGYFASDRNPQLFSGEWVRTGDYGYMDTSGGLVLAGRISSTINIGGFLVNPDEVEALLTEFDNVADALVYGERDAAVGETVKAKLVLKDSEKPFSYDALLTFCKRRLASYKLPRSVEVVESIPHGRYSKKVRT